MLKSPYAASSHLAARPFPLNRRWLALRAAPLVSSNQYDCLPHSLWSYTNVAGFPLSPSFIRTNLKRATFTEIITQFLFLSSLRWFEWLVSHQHGVHRVLGIPASLEASVSTISSTRTHLYLIRPTYLQGYYFPTSLHSLPKLRQSIVVTIFFRFSLTPTVSQLCRLQPHPSSCVSSPIIPFAGFPLHFILIVKNSVFRSLQQSLGVSIQNT